MRDECQDLVHQYIAVPVPWLQRSDCQNRPAQTSLTMPPFAKRKYLLSSSNKESCGISQGELPRSQRRHCPMTSSLCLQVRGEVSGDTSPSTPRLALAASLCASGHLPVPLMVPLDYFRVPGESPSASGSICNGTHFQGSFLLGAVGFTDTSHALWRATRHYPASCQELQSLVGVASPGAPTCRKRVSPGCFKVVDSIGYASSTNAQR